MNLLLVDDHPLILTAMEQVLAARAPHISVTSVGSAEAAREQLLGTTLWDLVLVDLYLADANGLELMDWMRREMPRVPVAVLSASERPGDVIRALDVGAMGYIPKRGSHEALMQAIQVVAEGGLYLPERLLANSPRGAAAAEADGRTATTVVSQQVAQAGVIERLGLTPRQTEVLELLLEGKANKLIARELNLSVETVKDHVAALLRALNVHSRTQAVLVVSQLTQAGMHGGAPVPGGLARPGGPANPEPMPGQASWTLDMVRR